jgi:1-aminocyclopropane-1-carboxylate deaminase/D-cysteine desulfhydrase-like pyridoxal-dependent ACC family enzyme
MSTNWQLPSPLVDISDIHCQARNIQLLLKREDQIHPKLSGNKWRKLNYNLQAAQTDEYHTLVTFGGAFSNHIAATAAAGSYYQFQTHGIIRGESSSASNPTLQQAKKDGMQLHFVDRLTYRNTDRLTLAKTLVPGRFYFLPEGGTNALAVKGCAEIVDELEDQLEKLPDFIGVSCGTGGTLTGIIQGMHGRKQVLGFAALKGNFLTKEVKKLIHQPYANWEIIKNYHFGGYAKIRPHLIEFMQTFYQQHHIPLEPIYTGKLLYGLFDLVQKDFFPSGSTIVAIHTGGLQGIAGINERFGLNLPLT